MKQEGSRSPCTADVLNAVLDMNMNQTIAIPSTSTLVASLASSVAASCNASTTSIAHATAASSSSTIAPTAIPGTSLLASTSNGQQEASRLGFAFHAPSTTEITANSISHANLAATTAAALLQQQTTIAHMISSQQNTLNQSMPNLHAGFQPPNNNSAPASNALAAPRASPALTNHSPRSTSHLME